MSSRITLSAATQDRKARLAQLKSLKRKQPEPEPEIQNDNNSFSPPQSSKDQELPAESEQEAEVDVTRTYLSGRNYDPETRGPKLGFESAPNDGKETLETLAASLAETTKKTAEEEEVKDAPLDLFKLQPKKPNWDLKRELREKMQVLDVRTDNAIARLVRKRLEGENAKKNGNGEGGGLDGEDLVTKVHAMEREEEEEEKREREREKEEMMGDAS
ncbi:hypothetical protein EJ08DRAFT_648520 [Tothia fuscella]|uniref:Uncharacterized protein n=1 Tax=Tothia fuscella TaxID=1048955 RepID=A0A9P4NV65_9PEZI|nr:hypothetical protein EJ08DRAFT_648520 [Tothia fuscella]